MSCRSFHLVFCALGRPQNPTPGTQTHAFLFSFAFFRRLGRGHKKALSALFRLQVAAGEHRRLVYNALMLAGEVWSSTLCWWEFWGGGDGPRVPLLIALFGRYPPPAHADCFCPPVFPCKFCARSSCSDRLVLCTVLARHSRLGGLCGRKPSVLLVERSVLQPVGFIGPVVVVCYSREVARDRGTTDGSPPGAHGAARARCPARPPASVGGNRGDDLGQDLGPRPRLRQAVGEVR